MEIYQQYIDIQKQIEELETAKDNLRIKIAEQLPAEGFKDEKINAYWVARKSYKYSSKIEEMSDSLKTAKKKEEEEGIATCEESKQLTIKVK